MNNFMRRLRSSFLKVCDALPIIFSMDGCQFVVAHLLNIINKDAHSGKEETELLIAAKALRCPL
jgi:hypothetical protein